MKTNIKRYQVFLLSALVLNSLGCAAVVGGAAGAAGTAVWLSGKLTQDVNATLDQTRSATRKALESLNLPVKEEKIDTTAQTASIKSELSDNRLVWIDLKQQTTGLTRIEVRVGVTGDKDQARRILDQILGNLPRR